jgi:hypothetical protein
MLSSPALKKLGVTPARLALIGVLAVMLLSVLVYQFGTSGGQDKNPAPLASEEPSAEQHAAPQSQSGIASQAPASLAPWPKLPLEQISQHDPFRLPPVLRKELGAGLDSPQSPQAEHNQQLLSELTSAGTGMVIVSGGQRIARVGANTLRVGDTIGGYRVWKIDAQGVWLVDDTSSQQ